MTQALVRQDVPSLEGLGAIFYKSGMFPDIKSEAQAVVKILAGQELGLPPIYSMTKIAIVKGRVTVGAEAIAALVKRDSHYHYQVTEHSSERCSIDFYEDGKKAYSSTFTMADAKGAGLVKQDSAWQTYPRAMLFSRAVSQGARIVCPHLIAGVYTHEEMGMEVTEEGELVAPPVVEPIETSSATAATTSPLLQAALQAGATLDQPKDTAWKPVCPDHGGELKFYPNWKVGDKVVPKWAHKAPSGAWCPWEEKELRERIEQALVDNRGEIDPDELSFDEPPIEEIRA